MAKRGVRGKDDCVVCGGCAMIFCICEALREEFVPLVPFVPGFLHEWHTIRGYLKWPEQAGDIIIIR
jgi:hypothetical protein